MSASGVLELRQYSLRPGCREALVTLFEREFVESQEALGMALPGQFRDLDDPDRFVWLRGFADMSARPAALAGFYDGPVWRAHREQANATMLDSDDVLLLRPLQGLDLRGLQRPVLGAAPPGGLLVASVCAVSPDTATELATDFETRLRPSLEAHGARVLATYLSETARNNFPRLPVREDEHVFVWFAAFADAAAHARHLAALAVDPVADAVFQAWQLRLEAPPQTLRLTPTPRSLLRGVPDDSLTTLSTARTKEPA